MQAEFAAKVAAIGSVLAYWKLDEASGSSFAATTGGVNGTWNGTTCAGGDTGPDGVALAAKNNGTATRYGKTSSNVDLSGSNTITLVAWFKYSATSNYQVAVEHANVPTFSKYLQLLPDTNIPNFNANVFNGTVGSAAQRISDPANALGGGALASPSTGAWHMVAIVVDLSQSTIAAQNVVYLDKVAYGKANGIAQTAGTKLGNYPLTFLGRDGGSIPMTGSLSNVAIFSKALTSTEVADLYDAMLVPASQTIAVGQATDTETAQVIAVDQGQMVAVGQATDTSTAQGIVLTQEIPVGQALETDTGLPASPVGPGGQVIPLGQATDTSTAQAVATITTAGGPQGGLAYLFPALSSAQTVTVGQAVDVQYAMPVAPIGPTDQVLLVGQALETDTAFSAEPPAPPPGAADRAALAEDPFVDRVLIGVSER